MINDNAQATVPWTEYWLTGNGVSCFKGDEAESHLARFWGEHVDCLPNYARILDLATGNGVVAQNCVARARERQIRLYIDAVDAADINPPDCVSDPDNLFRHVRFQGGVSLEDLPFGDGDFSGVVSQFGFEYAQEEQAAIEAARVLAPGGYLRLVIHAKDGVMVRDIARRLARLSGVMTENGPVSLVRTLARAAEAGDINTLNSKSRYLADAVAQTKILCEKPPSNDSALFYSKEFMMLWAQRKLYKPADLLRSIEDGWNNVNSMVLRQEQMMKAARSRNAIDRLAQQLVTVGLAVDNVEQIYDNNRNTQIAWKVDARKI